MPPKIKVTKENLIEAVKALDYRASLDLQDAHPDDYAVSA